MTVSNCAGAAIFSPGLAEVLLIKQDDLGGYAFPFAVTDEPISVVAAASAVRQLLGVDIGDKISRQHWLEAEFSQTGALVRLYVALGVRSESVRPNCGPGSSAQWHPLRAILPPVNAILRADSATAGAAGSVDDGLGAGEDEGGSLALEPGVAPFLAKLKALLNKHPEWRISQLDPELTRLIQEAISLPPEAQYATQHAAAQRAPPQLQHLLQQQLRVAEEAPRAAGQRRPGAAAAEAGPGQGAAAGTQPADTDAAGEGPSPSRQGAPGSPGAAGDVEGSARDGSAGPRVKEEPEDGRGAVGPVGSVPNPTDPEAGPVGADAGASAHGEAEGRSGHGAGAGADGGSGAAAADGGAAGADAGAEGEGSGSGSWRGPRPQAHLLEYCRLHQLPEPCYSLVVKKSARRPLVTASCILPHLGVQITPDMHVPGGMHAACQAAALAAILWLEGALPPDGGESVRVVPVGWPPLLSEARAESWEAAQAARRAVARREVEAAQREALLREMDKKRQRLVAEAAELERLMAALRDGAVPEQDLSQLTAALGLGGGGAAGGAGAGAGAEAVGALEAAEAGAGAPGPTAAPRSNSGGLPAANGGDGGGGGLAGSVTAGLRQLQFRNSGSGSGSQSGQAAAGRGNGSGSGRPPGTKRPREDGTSPGTAGGQAAGGDNKNVVMELKELCDRKRWPQPQYAYTATQLPAGSGGAGAGTTSSGALAVVTLSAVAGVGEVSSGPQTNRKRAKEAAAAAALAQLSALGLK